MKHSKAGSKASIGRSVMQPDTKGYRSESDSAAYRGNRSSNVHNGGRRKVARLLDVNAKKRRASLVPKHRASRLSMNVCAVLSAQADALAGGVT